MLFKKSALSVIAALLVSFAVATGAQAECKGMSKSKCEKSTSCTYVKGYTNSKTGKKVSAYCRNKGKSGSSSSKSSSKSKQKEAAKKADSKKKDTKKKDSKKKDDKK